MPAMLSARRIGSAWPLARTRIGVVARRGAALDPPADLGGDPVGLLRAGREDLEADRRRRRRRRAAARSRLTIPARTSSRSGSLNRMSR